MAVGDAADCEQPAPGADESMAGALARLAAALGYRPVKSVTFRVDADPDETVSPELREEITRLGGFDIASRHTRP